MNSFSMTVSALLLCAVITSAQDAIKPYYTVSDIATPMGLDPQIGGLTFLPDGRLAICCHRGEIYLFEPKTATWQLFAEGLQEPLGLIAEDSKTLVVMQRAELTMIKDTDGDGAADHYQTLCDDFGVSGNYHEFAFGPAIGPKGDYWIALNTASNGAGIRAEVRGEFQQIGRPGRMYACVPYRGWIVRVDRKTGAMHPIACGLRSPDGIGFDTEGRLLVSDNQGDWLGTSKLFVIKPGGFYGHVSSLVWRDDWKKGDPLKLSVRELDDMRVPASVLFPQGIVANSPTQPIPDDTDGRFGPFAGQTLIGEMNSGKILRLMLEDVGGATQGATVTFYDNAGLKGGVHRMAFDADARLWIGHTALSWAGGKGLQRLAWTGAVPMEVLHARLTAKGFALTFTKPVNPSTISKAAFTCRRYYYRYHRTYGSDRMQVSPVEVVNTEISDNRKTVTLELGELRPGFVHELHIGDVESEGGDAVIHRLVCYTLNRLLDGTIGRPQWESQPRKKSEPIALTASALQAEQAGRIDGAEVDSKNPGFRGTGYVDYANMNGDLVEWTVDVAASGSRTLHVRYALASGDRPLDVLVDGKVAVQALSMPGTGSWDLWRETKTALDLEKGVHRIGLRAAGKSGPNVDEIRID